MLVAIDQVRSFEFCCFLTWLLALLLNNLKNSCCFGHSDDASRPRLTLVVRLLSTHTVECFAAQIVSLLMHVPGMAWCMLHNLIICVHSCCPVHWLHRTLEFNSDTIIRRSSSLFLRWLTRSITFQHAWDRAAWYSPFLASLDLDISAETVATHVE